ncbi:MAG: hypothetical protein KF861_10205 [Planctomycetaceae bacterium]|nr:hypothetical protein [Planctomycetaceae bacterium]
MHANSRFPMGNSSMAAASPQMMMTVGEFCEILSHACETNRTWLQDFDRDEVWVSEDLFVVMQAYWNLKSAA